MLGPKRHRKNYYKNSAAKRKAGLILRLRAGLKIAAVAMGAVTLSCLFIFCYSLLTQATFFEASYVTVAGNHRLSAQAVRDHAALR